MKIYVNEILFFIKQTNIIQTMKWIDTIEALCIKKMKFYLKRNYLNKYTLL